MTDRRVGDSSEQGRLHQRAVFLSDDLVPGRPGDTIQTPPGWPHGGLGGEIVADGDEGPCDLSSERVRAEGNPTGGSDWFRRRFVDGPEGEGLIDAVERAQMELGHYMTMPEDATRIAVETIGTALSWWRERTFETWKPVWLFLGPPKHEKLIGVGWRGRLIFWRDPLVDTYQAYGADYHKVVTEEHLRQTQPRRDAFVDAMSEPSKEEQ